MEHKQYPNSIVCILAMALVPLLAIADEAAKRVDTPSSTAVRQVVGGRSPSFLPQETGTMDISEKMNDLLSTAKETGEVLRLWADFKAGKKDAVPQIFALAKNGNVRAQNLAGFMLDNGEGVVKDSKAAATYFQHAAREFPLAKYNLGVLTFYGRGVRQDERKAMALFQESAINAGVEQACVQLALYYLKHKQDAEAYKWANEAANRGNVKGFYLLGRILYQRGKYAEAWTWIQKAASASEPNAPAVLSLMYRDGNGVAQSSLMSAAWWMIYSGMNRKHSGSITTSAASFGLNDEEQRRAISFANNWLATHGTDRRINYEKTLIQTD